ncbi:MAG TPA: hypothetical protein VEK37_04465, partial [Gemmatimonadaceae bacterium]|nr:hypothetical protein [Gemmatimonadaceae bacterium]
DGHHAYWFALPILGDEHSSARPVVQLLDSFRDVSGIGGVAQLGEKPAKRWRIAIRCRSDTYLVHHPKN